LVAEAVMPHSAALRERWWEGVTIILGETFILPALADVEPVNGGRHGQHSEHLTQLLDAMQLLHHQFPGARW
jgi:ring-1,2-phenylacetyl-CoA epoxidase subunit PaaC